MELCLTLLSAYNKSTCTTEMDTFQRGIDTLVKTLTRQQKIAFAYCVCVRLQPHYQYFYNVEAWGDPTILQTAINTIGTALLSELPATSLKQMYNQVEVITPDTEDFPDILSSFALDSCCAVLSSLSFLMDNSSNNIIEVATYARDTVDMYVQELYDLSSNEPDLEERIAKAPYMLNEIKWQKATLEKLKDINYPAEDLLNELVQGKMIDIDLAYFNNSKII